MSKNYDNYNSRPVNAVLLREKLLQIGGEDSLSSVSSSDYFTWSFREIDSPLADFSNLGISFSYQEIALATGFFSDDNLIKRGQSGDLFTGQLSGPVVVKRFYFQNQEAFSLELGFFSRIKTHPRFVPLLGHCFETETETEREKFLVYRYLPERDLSNSLFINNPDRPLDWITRLKIARGVAEGLAYLHHQCNPPLVHGYYSYSVLLELVTGKLSISSSSTDTTSSIKFLEAMLPCINLYDKTPIMKIVDRSLRLWDEDHLKEVWSMAIIAKACLNPSPTRRPPVRYILNGLEYPLRVVEERSLDVLGVKYRFEEIK
ncbi:hypothetical protein DH2020_006782 [Rehmannia glutinosa]|uniref:Protein kinase domain-containing protein n=1 Tax=Rehmannia glutinosa TaxID=99300 RepID=A0ABR0XJX1_REHGL